MVQVSRKNLVERLLQAQEGVRGFGVAMKISTATETCKLDIVSEVLTGPSMNRESTEKETGQDRCLTNTIAHRSSNS